MMSSNMLLELSIWSLYKEETINYLNILDTGKTYSTELSMKNSIDVIYMGHFKARP